jgi:methionine biosynthesis protein MetW
VNERQRVELERVPIRADFKEIARIVEVGSRVLDLGCGAGELLDILVKYKGADARGVEIAEENVMACIGKGLTVFQGNLDEGLRDYETNSFDYVILNLTLQVVHKPLFVLEEMLRVGKKALVGFPNFGHWPFRLKLLVTGRMPRTKALPYEWYNTPNIHLLTIKDFVAMCKGKKFEILRSIYMLGGTGTRGRTTKFLPNLLADYALFELARK